MVIPIPAIGLRAIGASMLLWGAWVVPVSADSLVALKDFVVCRLYLPQEGQNPGKLYVSFEQPNRVPAVIRSITVEGPEGFAFSFNQAPLTGSNLNGYHRIPAVAGAPAETVYFGLTRQPMPDGLYTVTVVDVAGHVVGSTRTFLDGSASFLPQIDSIDYSRFVPINGQRGVSPTPVISWDIAEGAELYYVLRVRDGFVRVFEDHIFENGTGLNKSSLVLPAGVLERGTRYNWNVEVCDRDVLGEINNCAWLPTFHFTTRFKKGVTGTPEEPAAASGPGHDE